MPVRPGRLADFPGVRTLGYRPVNDTRELNDVFEGEGFHGGSNVYISARDLLGRLNASPLYGWVLRRIRQGRLRSCTWRRMYPKHI
jgi:hypothetical protein